MLYQNHLYRKKAQHLNYYEQLPDNVNREALNTVRRENILKNVVYSRILEIREEKRKPKLGEVLAALKKNFEGGIVDKDYVIDKLKLLYDKQEINPEEKEDKKF